MAKPRSKFKKVKWLFGKEIEIPEEWDTILISAEFKLKTGGTPSRTQPRYFDGDIHWVTSTDLNRSSITSTLESISWDAKEITRLEIFQKGTFVIATYGLEAAGTRGKCGILNVNATINQACLAFIPTGKIITKFLFYFYLKYGEQIAFNYAQGTKQQNLYPGIVGKISITKPPIPEQQKIASILSRVDALIESTQEVIAKTERLKKGLMQELMTRGIGHTKFKKVKWLFGKELEIPDEWNMLKLIELSDDKPQYGSGNPALQYTSKLPRYIRITDIDDDGNLKNNAVSVNLTNNEKNLLEEDDFLFARTGSVGRTFLFSSKFGRCVYAGYLIRFRLTKEKLLPKFLHYYTHSRRYWVWVTSELTHGVQPNLNAQQYSKLTVLVPSSLEQTKIASILSRVDAYIQKNQEYKKKIELLKKGLMQKLLTGQIRVKVDH